MGREDIVSDSQIDAALSSCTFFELNVFQGRLMLTELLVKANAGYRNSHTEEAFMNSFGLLKRDRTLNKAGRRFICGMLYKHSNNKSDFVSFSETYRR